MDLTVSLSHIKKCFNWAFFESKFLQISAPKGPIAAKYCMDVKHM